MSQKQRRYVRAPIYDPDPDPFVVTGSIIVLSVLGVAGLGLWTNKGILNNIMLLLNPAQAELDAEKLKVQQETIRAMVLIVALIVLALGMMLYYRGKQEEKLLKKEVRGRRRARKRGFII